MPTLLKPIDSFLNKITMYRLVLYYLIGLIVAAFALSFFKLLPYNPLGLLFSAFFVTIVCVIANTIFAWAFNAQTNVESVYITALILVLIINPLQSPQDPQFFALAVWASLLAMATKYLLAIGRKHVFNPAAIAVMITVFTLNLSASWWIGTARMSPFVILGGLLLVRKLRRVDLVVSFLFFSLLSIMIFHFLNHSNLSSFEVIKRALLESPVLFFAFVMLTEPLTTPPTRKLRIGYGTLTGILFAPAFHIGSIYSTPELALIVGNMFSYIVSPKEKLVLTVRQKIRSAEDVYTFIFSSTKKLLFKSGQYLEWTLAHKRPDTRGNRRYFTIASSPTEAEIIIGVKFYPDSSSFKKTLHNLEVGDAIIASQRAGDFTLPDDLHKKLVFIAGGIGVTPFRSMIKFLLDTNDARDVIQLYSNKHAADIAYKDIFDEAATRLGIKTVYTLSDTSAIPVDWQGKQGTITQYMIAENIPDFKERFFYISGPNAFVTGLAQVLSGMGVPRSHIKKDFFPGFV